MELHVEPRPTPNVPDLRAASFLMAILSHMIECSLSIGPDVETSQLAMERLVLILPFTVAFAIRPITRILRPEATLWFPT